jgi:hypothetical protein
MKDYLVSVTRIAYYRVRADEDERAVDLVLADAVPEGEESVEECDGETVEHTVCAWEDQ